MSTSKQDSFNRVCHVCYRFGYYIIYNQTLKIMMKIAGSLAQERNHVVSARVDAFIGYALNILIRVKAAEIRS